MRGQLVNGVAMEWQESPLSVAEVSDILGVSKMSVYRYIHEGRLEASRVGTSYRVTAKSLRRMLAETPPRDK